MAKDTRRDRKTTRSKGRKQSELAQDELESRVTQLRERWLRLQSRSGGEGSLKPPAHLKREVYKLALDLAAAHDVNSVNCALKELRRSRNPRARTMDGVFRLLIELVVGNRMSRGERIRLAAELKYAQRHGIHPDLVIGFILQVGKSITNYARDKTRYEPWYRHGMTLQWVETPETRAR